MSEPRGDGPQAVVAVYSTQALAEQAVFELQKAGLDPAQLSIVGRDYRKGEHIVGYYNTGDRVARWGQHGAFWGGIWGGWLELLFGTGFCLIPGLGPVAVAGPVAAWLVGILEGAIVVGGLSALGAAVYSMTIPNNTVLEYETDLRAEHFVVFAHGSAASVRRARNILDDHARQYYRQPRTFPNAPMSAPLGQSLSIRAAEDTVVADEPPVGQDSSVDRHWRWV